MAGIARRRRPRVRSVNFRRLRWLLIREAALMILRNCDGLQFSEHTVRAILAAEDQARIERNIRRILTKSPARAYCPGPPNDQLQLDASCVARPPAETFHL